MGTYKSRNGKRRNELEMIVTSLMMFYVVGAIYRTDIIVSQYLKEDTMDYQTTGTLENHPANAH